MENTESSGLRRVAKKLPGSSHGFWTSRGRLVSSLPLLFFFFWYSSSDSQCPTRSFLSFASYNTLHLLYPRPSRVLFFRWSEAPTRVVLPFLLFLLRCTPLVPLPVALPSGTHSPVHLSHSRVKGERTRMGSKVPRNLVDRRISLIRLV